MLWMPYFRYKKTHLQHHRKEWLTDPLQDPESAYHSPERWQRMSQPARWLRKQKTHTGMRAGIAAPIGGYDTIRTLP